MMTRNEIFTNVRAAVLAVYPSAYITAAYEPVLPRFPAVFVREIGSVRTQRYITLAFDDEQRRSTFEVQIFVNKADGGMTYAYEIAEVVEGAFNDMYFIEDMKQPVDNLIDDGVYRLTMRFHRQLANNRETTT